MSRPLTVDLEEVAAFYNDRARINPTNAPTRREIAKAFGDVSTATAQRWLDDLEDRDRLCWPVRRAPGRRGKGS